MNYTCFFSQLSLRITRTLCFCALLLILLSSCGAGDIVFGRSNTTPTPTRVPTPTATPSPIPTIATSGDGQPISQAIDPCSLITVDEAAQVFEGPMKIVVSGKPSSPLPILGNPGATEITTSCLYGATEPPARGFALNLVIASDPASARTLFQNSRTNDTGVQDINGLGDAAYFGSQNFFYVLKDNVEIFFIVVGSKDSATILQEAKQLAQYAVNRV